VSLPGSGPGAIFAGAFLILFGLGIVLAGGACTVMWVSLLYTGWAYGGGPGTFGFAMLLVAIVNAGLGAFCMERGIRVLRPPRGGN
jgi:hypothetical protein